MKHIVIRFSFRIALAALLMALVVPSAIAQHFAQEGRGKKTAGPLSFFVATVYF